MDNIKNIVFDLGGVLVDLNKQRCMDAFQRIGARDIIPYVRDHRTEDLFLDIELGRINRRQFCEEVRRICYSTTRDEDIVWAWNQLLVGISNIKLQRLNELRRTYRLFLLSNTNEMHWEKCADEMFSYQHYSADDLFEKIFLSYEYGMAKPNPAIYEITVLEADIDPTRTLYIDDLNSNCNVARRMGFKVFQESTGTDWLNLFKEPEKPDGKKELK